MPFFAPFSFIKSSIVIPIPVPPFEPFAYYDATNTQFATSVVWNDSVSAGDPNMSLLQDTFLSPEPAQFPVYTPGEYYTFNELDYTALTISGGELVNNFDPINNLRTGSHTLVALMIPTQNTNECFIGGSGVINFITQSVVVGFVGGISPGPDASTSSSISTPTGSYWFGGQRFTTSSGDIGQVDALSGDAASLPITITNGKTGSRESTGFQGKFKLGWTDAGAPRFFNGQIAQVAVYLKPLSDSEIQDVCVFMADRQGL